MYTLKLVQVAEKSTTSAIFENLLIVKGIKMFLFALIASLSKITKLTYKYRVSCQRGVRYQLGDTL